jgi:hypothetical protein
MKFKFVRAFGGVQALAMHMVVLLHALQSTQLLRLPSLGSTEHEREVPILCL